MTGWRTLGNRARLRLRLLLDGLLRRRPEDRGRWTSLIGGAPGCLPRRVHARRHSPHASHVLCGQAQLVRDLHHQRQSQSLLDMCTCDAHGVLVTRS